MFVQISCCPRLVILSLCSGRFRGHSLGKPFKECGIAASGLSSWFVFPNVKQFEQNLPHFKRFKSTVVENLATWNVVPGTALFKECLWDSVTHDPLSLCPQACIHAVWIRRWWLGLFRWASPSLTPTPTPATHWLLGAAYAGLNAGVPSPVLKSGFQLHLLSVGLSKVLCASVYSSVNELIITSISWGSGEDYMRINSSNAVSMNYLCV